MLNTTKVDIAQLAGLPSKLTEKHHDLCRWVCCGRPHCQSRNLQETCRSRCRRLQGAWRIETRRVLGDDVPDGKVTSFPMAVKRKDDETVVFSWIIWPSRKVRDEGMKKVMADPRLQPDKNPMPFDGKRLIYGGFEMIVDA